MKPSARERLDCAIVTFYFPPHLGGLEYYLQRLAAALNSKIAVAVLAPETPGCAEIDRDLPFEVIRRKMLAATMIGRPFWFKPLYPLAGAAVFFWTWACLRGRRPRLICSGSADFGWAVALAARLIGSEFTFICHGKDGHVGRGLLALIGKRWPILWMIRSARICFANSRFTARLLDPDGRFEAKIKLLRVPIDKLKSPPPEKEAIEEAERIVWGGAGDKGGEGRGEMILSVGRLREHKGFQHAIEALAILKERFANCRYVIVGAGPFEGRLRETAERCGVADRVVFAGPRRPPDAFFSLADVFVTVTWPVPEEPEGFGMVFIEAGSFGVPSIAGNIGGMPEAVLNEETGLCVEGASPAVLAEALGRLLDDEPLRRRMGSAAREYAKAFDPDRIADQFIRDCGLGAGSRDDG